jgi:hypothetical protein
MRILLFVEIINNKGRRNIDLSERRRFRLGETKIELDKK